MEGAAKEPTTSDAVSLQPVVDRSLQLDQRAAAEEVALEETAVDEKVPSFKVCVAHVHELCIMFFYFLTFSFTL